MKTGSKGAAAPTAIIFTMVSMLLTLAYLRYTMTVSAMEKYRFAESKALYLAETGVNAVAVPETPHIKSSSVIFVDEEVDFGKDEFGNVLGQYKDVKCTTFTNPHSLQTVYQAKGTGVVTYKNTLGNDITIERTIALDMVPEDFSIFMYFTNSEEPGGGPYTDGYVTFGANDSLEGRVHTNGHMAMSQYGCPVFDGDVSAHDGIDLGSCSDQIFRGEWDDSAEVILYPPENSAELVKANANYVFTADDLLFRGLKKDTLIMTEIEFVPNGFLVSQWTYLIPPVGIDGPPPLTFEWDEDTIPGLLDPGRIGFDLGFDTFLAYWNADSLFISGTDIDGENVYNIIGDYTPGDTITITADPDSGKYWKGYITATEGGSGQYIFGVVTLEQIFINGRGFIDGEEVQLAYVAPLDPSHGMFNKFAYYHNHPDDGYSTCQPDGFHHFDFEPSGGEIIMPPTAYSYNTPTVIYVKGGQVRVKGVVDGRFTIVTDNYTEYRRHDNPSKIDRVYGNIWLIDDVVYEDSDSDGRVVMGTPNRLGLVAGGNVIIANTMANGARNSQYGDDIIINAAILAMHESFVCHYWQNTLSNSSYHGPSFGNPSISKGDGRGPYRNPTSLMPNTTLTSDMRGVVHLWGSIVQAKRGYMRRNSPGPYNDLPGIGYYKDYYYDYNFSSFGPPPFFPATSTSDGGARLRIVAYNEVGK